jgi:protein Tex
VHVSQLADRFVKDPSEVVKVGDKVSVRVLEVDLERRRIALTRKSGAQPGAGRSDAAAPGPKAPPRGPGEKPRGPAPKPAETFRNNPFAKHFRK